MPPSVFMADTAAHICTAMLLFLTEMSTELSFNRLVMTTVTSRPNPRPGLLLGRRRLGRSRALAKNATAQVR